VNAAVKEALSDPLMDKELLHSSRRVIVGIIAGSSIDDITLARIKNLISKRAFRQDIHIKVIIYDEMQEIVSVLIMAQR
jgi:cell division GTPase FtsZ